MSSRAASLCGLSLTTLLILTPPSGGTEDSVVAQRGADRLTLSQARAAVAALDPDARQRLTTAPAVTELLRNLLLQRGLLEQARAAKWDRRPEVAAASQRASDLAISQSFLAAQAPVPPGTPTDAEITAAYEESKPRLMQPRTYHLSQVFLPGAASEADAARRSLTALARQAALLNGGLADAAKHLHGAAYADLGWLTATQIVPAIEAVVSGLQEGATSDPVCTPGGCHLMHLIATRPPGPAPLAAVRDALVRALRQSRQATAEQAYINTLLARQPVQVNELAVSQVTAP